MSCQKAAVEDAVRAVQERRLPESIVYNGPKGPELDSWIQPGKSLVRIWATMDRNLSPVDQLFSARFGDTTRPGHIVAEIISIGPGGQRRDFNLGFVYVGDAVKGGGSLAHHLHPYEGRVISPDWIFLSKLKTQAKKPSQEHLRLLAEGVLSEETYHKLKHLVESSESVVRRDNDIDYRHIYDIRHPKLGGYRAAVPWVAGKALGTCHNCTSFIMDLFKGMVSCASRTTTLVVPGFCRANSPLRCDASGLPLREAAPEKRGSANEARGHEPEQKRRRRT